MDSTKTSRTDRRQAWKRAAATAAIALVCALYLADLTGMGLALPDEPRYAAIGQAMARTGDWITPRLWGAPWFEKPALLYWMIAAGFRLKLGPELAPRLPVALLSLAFLAFFWWRIRVEWDARVASYSAALLATSAGWLAYSHVAITDLPLAAFFSAAVLLALSWIAGRGRSGLTASAACLGLAALAKGLVPLVLFVPVLALGWRRLSDWLRPAPMAAFTVCAVPWYVLCFLRNGREFPEVFFVQHTFERFGSAALHHVQPWWYYVPAGLLLLYPWFPLLVYVRGAWREPRTRVLAVTAVFGFVFFSAAVNKLPSYLLPLMPAVCVLIGMGLARARQPGTALILALASLGALPGVPRALTIALAHGLRAARVPWGELAIGMALAGTAGAVLIFAAKRFAFEIAAATAGIGFLWFQFTVFPILDAGISARQIWISNHPECSPGLSRSLEYGLNYYSGRIVPVCTVLDPGGTSVVR